ncbi:hypothetical protein WJX77_007000 [Trebouxia sp. C0004]
MYGIKNSIHKVYKGAAEAVLPVRSQSRFKEEGVLTPDEFVTAGDYLSRTYPNWEWAAGVPSKTLAHLPKDKQYLVIRNVPCKRRVAEVEGYDEAAEQLLETDAEGDGWVSTAEASHRNTTDAEIPDLEDDTNQTSITHHATSAEEDVPDLDDLGIEDEDDEAAVPRNGYLRAEEPEDHVVRLRTYNLHITYDKYYSVPKFWLIGRDESGQPLQTKQVLEDVSEEHARKTVTVETFPHDTSLVAAAIHPCKHAVTMKKLGSMMEQGGKTFTVDQYLVLFLKFIASVVPTIEFDNTMSAGL